MDETTYRSLLGRFRKHSLRFSEFLDLFVTDPEACLRTSSTLISEAIEHFGYRIVVRSGEPALSYNIFRDPFSGGTNAVFGQEFCIKRVVDVIEAVGKESGPNRGIVLVGPPASGKTNIVDLISLALEEYTKHEKARLYSFFFRFEGTNGKIVEIRPPFRHNPILLVPTSLQQDHQPAHPRQELFEHVNADRGKHEKVVFPTFYQNATLDKRSLDILKGLLENPGNADKSLFDLIETYVRVEEIEFSNAQAKGIANIDDMGQLRVQVHSNQLGTDRQEVLEEHLPGAHLHEYHGATVAANRGLLHIHDAFGTAGVSGPGEQAYKPLLMLLGSGRASIESTQAPIDTTVILTTNIEEMAQLEEQLTSSKLLDRIEKIRVNYLLDAHSEMEILRRDMANMRDKYDVDPNLLRVASYFSVLTRLLPPVKPPPDWPDAKKEVYRTITPEQKLFIYACQPEDPTATLRKLPHWHPFRGEMLKRSISVHDDEAISALVQSDPTRLSLEQTGMFTGAQLKVIDDGFMRALTHEHSIHEGQNGISVRQLQNIMRDTIARSDGLRVHAGSFFNQVERALDDAESRREWLPMPDRYREDHVPLSMRMVTDIRLAEGEGDYGDYAGLGKVAQAIYRGIIRREITVATVNRDPTEIEADLRRYLQHALLAKAHANQAFAHIMIPRFSYTDPASGNPIDRPDERFMAAIEAILAPADEGSAYRLDIAQRFLDLQAAGELGIEPERSVVASHGDNLLGSFGAEYERLLSHRRDHEAVDPDHLVEAFFKRRRDPDAYGELDKTVREFAEDVLFNLVHRFGYSKRGALETIVYAVRKEVVDFAQMIR